MIEKITFSIHAKERMRSRGITDSMVRSAINNPNSIVEDSECKRIYHKTLDDGQSIMLLRVFVNPCKEPPVVITAYKTSKIEKYEY